MKNVLAAFAFAAFLLPAAVLADSTVLPNGTYTYDVAVNGKSIGTSTITIDRPDAATIRLKEKNSFGALSAEATSIIDATTYQAKTFDASYNTPQGAQSAHATFSPGKIDISVPGQPDFHAKADAKAPLMELSDNFTLVGAISGAAQWNHDKAASYTQVSLQGGKIEVVPVAAATITRPDGVPAGDLGVSETDSDGTGTLWYNPQTFIPDFVSSGPATVTLTGQTH